MIKSIPLTFHPNDTNEICEYMTGRAWDVLDPVDGRELFMLRAKLELLNGGGKKHILYQETILNHFDNLATYRDNWSDDLFYDNDDSVKVQFKGDVFYKDRKKKKTIVAFSSRGQWAKNLIMPLSDRWTHPEYDWIGFDGQGYDDYNFISFQEDITRAYANPTVEPSALFRGVNDTLDSPKKVADHIMSMFGDTELHFISDCKSGLATAYVAQLCNAKSLFLIAPMASLSMDNINPPDYWGATETAGPTFVFWVRSQMYLGNTIPYESRSITEIARLCPDMKVQIYYHEDDLFMFKNVFESGHHDYSGEPPTDNLTVTYIADTKYCSGNHHIINEIRRSKYYNKFLDNL